MSIKLWCNHSIYVIEPLLSLLVVCTFRVRDSTTSHSYLVIRFRIKGNPFIWGHSSQLYENKGMWRNIYIFVN